MEYCKYHPLSAAKHTCGTCQINTCDNCIDDGEHGKLERCFVCSNKTLSLGDAYTALPFWRRLQESFRYPLNIETLILIIGVAFLGSVILYIPFGFIWWLLITGAMFKYCFSCLENTSNGLLVAPEINAAYGGGLKLLAQLLAIVLSLSAITFFSYQYLGVGIAGFIGIFSIVAFPAILINLALSENLFTALNPLKILQLMSAIGLPYGLILAFIMIMSASVGVINELIGNDFSLISEVLQTAVAYYYLVVIFHIMGYMIFQYQGKLGFIAHSDYGVELEARSEIDRESAKIGVMLKEGNYREVSQLYQKAVDRWGRETNFHADYFEFLLATHDTESIDDFVPLYFNGLIRDRKEDQINILYKRTLKSHAKFIPQDAELRFFLAKACQHSGDSGAAVKLINGMHKKFPLYHGLPQAYELMAECLDDIPNMEKNAQQCRKLAQQLQRIQTSRDEAKPKKTIETKSKEVNISSENSSSVGDQSSESIEEKVKDDGVLPPIEFKL